MINPKWVELLEKENDQLREYAKALEIEAIKLRCSSELIQWLASGTYRVLMQRHDGTFRAVDEAFNILCESDTLQGLMEQLNEQQENRV